MSFAEQTRGQWERVASGDGARSVESFARKLSDGQTRIAPLYSEAAEGAVAPRWSTSPVRTGVDWASWGSDVAVPRSPAAGLQAGAGESASWIRPEQLATLKADAGDIFLDGPALGVPPGRSIHVLGDPSEPSFQDVWGARGAGQLAVGVRADRLYAEGASTRQVIGAALAGVIESCLALEARGWYSPEAQQHIGVVVTFGDELWEAIAGYRALRLALGRLQEAAGLGEGAISILGRVGARRWSWLDPGNNLIRASVEATAMFLGGVDWLFMPPLGSHGSAAGGWLARQVPEVLREEAKLDRGVDSVFGSYFLESLSLDLARAGWSELQAILQEGGLKRASKGPLGERVAEHRASLERAAATRKSLQVGVNEFAVSSIEPPAEHVSLPSGFRVARPFEALRVRARSLDDARGKRPLCWLVGSGDPAKLRAREEFCRRFAEVGGFAVETRWLASLAPASVDTLVTGEGGGVPDVVVLIVAEPATLPLDEWEAWAKDRLFAFTIAAVRGRGGLSGEVALGADALATLGRWLDVIESRGAK